MGKKICMTKEEWANEKLAWLFFGAMVGAIAAFVCATAIFLAAYFFG